MTAIMEHFETINFLPDPFAVKDQLHDLEYLSATSHVDPFDQYSTYDSEPYFSGDEMSYTHASLAQQTMMKRMSSGFEDPFAESTMAQFRQMQSDTPAPSPPTDSENKYLSFTSPISSYSLYNDAFQPCLVNVQAQVHGMFFLAESQLPTTIGSAPIPPELTCYRRNLFQVTGSVTVPRSLRYVFTDDGRRLPIYDLEVLVSATESVEGNPVKLISVPWKSSSSSGTDTPKSEEKVEQEPVSIPLDKASGSDIDLDHSIIPISWKRLQFRIATANNGRRKELQQHFNVHLKVVATCSTGERLCISEALSSAIIVRGRSPRNFAARKDIPLGSSASSRKHIPSLSRAHESTQSVASVTSAPKQESPQQEVVPPRPHPLFEKTEIPKPMIDLNGWQQTQFSNVSPTSYPVQLPTTGQNPDFASSFSMHHSQPGFQFHYHPQEVSPHRYDGSEETTGDLGGGGGTPIPFMTQPTQTSRRSSRPPTSNPSPSLLDKPRANAFMHTFHSHDCSGEPPNKQRPRMHSYNSSIQRTTSLTPTTLAAGYENPQLLQSMSSMPPSSGAVDEMYEYFPLGIDGWQPSIVGEETVTHNYPRSVSSDMRSPSGRNKRYFSEVV